jgi:hypothetical protein
MGCGYMTFGTTLRPLVPAVGWDFRSLANCSATPNRKQRLDMHTWMRIL